MQNRPYEPSPRLSLALLAALTILAAALRLPKLSAEGLWFDEAATWSQVNGTFLDMLSDTISDNYPPLYNTVAWLFVQAFGCAEWVLRLPATLFGIALVPMIYLLGARVAGRSAGLLAALLVTLSAFHIWYSLEARMYSLLALAACAFVWATLRDVERQDRGSGRTLVGIGLALLLSHPYGTLDWIAVSTTALLFSPNRSRLLRLLAITGAIFAPFGLALLVHAYEINNRGFWIPAPTSALVLQQWMNLTSSLLPGLVLAAAIAFLPRRDVPRTPALPLLLALATVPSVVGVTASLLTKPIFLDRYIIGSLPALIVLAAAGLARCFPRRFVLASATIAVAAAATATMLYDAPAPRPDWRTTTATIAPQLRADDCVIVRPQYNTLTWAYYAPHTCLARTLEQVPNKAALHRLFYAVQSSTLDQDELGQLKSELQLTSTTTIQDITVYEFAVPGRQPKSGGSPYRP